MTPKPTASCAAPLAPSLSSTSAAGRTAQVCAKRCWPVERSNAWLLENKRLALRYDRLGFIVQSLLQAACLFLVAGRLAREL